MKASAQFLLHGASATALIIGMALALPAYAQDAAADGQAESQATKTANADAQTSADTDSNAVAEVVVTGTNISGVRPVGSETITIGREEILATGLTNLNEVLQTLPQVQNNPNAGGSGPVYRQGGTSGYDGNATQGTAINLRGLGTSATLTLVDGRRVVPSGAGAPFTESIQVPIAAIERIEVVSDGNSAIYGSDAVSGVINYVLRKHFDGVEFTARDTFDRYHNNWGASVTAGHSWSTGNIIATYDYDSRESFISGESPFLRRDLRSLGGPDARAVDATIAVSTPTLLVGGNGQAYSYYTVPGNAGTNPQFTQLTSGANLVDSSYFNDYLGRQRRHQAAVFFNQELNSALSFFVEGFYTNRETTTGSYGNSRVQNIVTVCQGGPYYIAGAPAAAASSSALCGGALGQQIAVDPVTFFGGRAVTSNPTETISVTSGFKAGLPGSWNADAYVTYAHDSTCGICNYNNNANGAALAAEITAGRINPYSTTPLTQTQYASFMGTNTQQAWNTFYDAMVKLNGPLFSLPGGKVRTAFGSELAFNRQHLRNGSNNAFENDPTNNTYAVTNDATADRSTASAFAELFVPIVGGDMNVPLVKSLEVDVAIRYDDYSDFGGTTNPKVGATWDVNDAIAIRGSWGTSFRAPALTDTNPQNYSSAVVGAPFANNSGRTDIGFLYPGASSTYLMLGANPELKPETATTWSTGFDFRPSGTGFSFSATYYNTKYSNQIVNPNLGLFLSSPANAALYDEYITPVNNPAGCVNGTPSTYDPVLADFVAAHPAVYNTTIVGACSVNVILDARSTNAATTFQDGLDFQANYLFDIGKGHWSVGASATKILNQTIQPVAGAPETDVLDTFYYPVSLRGRGQIGWYQGRFGANLFINYVGSYTNTLPLTGQPQSKVPSWTTVDLGLRYEFPSEGAKFRSLRVAVNVQNLTNEDPPVTLTQAGNSYGAFDPSNANIFGRIVSLQLTSAF
ncbi:TonB-dependent receptor [soil metagenome]